MVFGFSKGFVVILGIAVFFWIGTENYKVFLGIVIAFIILKIIWKILT